MTDLTKLFLASLAAASLTLSGCGNESGSSDTHDHAEHGDHDGHAHDAEGHEGHDHDHDDHDHADGDHDGHGTGVDLGSVVVGATTLRVSMGGSVEASAVLHFDIEVVDGPEPAAVRIWIGDESGTGALKSKAMGSGGNYHADAEVPSEVTPEAALWVEVEASDGSRSSGSLTLK